GMWSADHLAGQARKQEQEGRREEARASWAQAAVKAESVVARHPHGRWADAALVLQGEGLAKSADCDRAATPLARALGSVKDTALLERAALAAAECDVAARDLAAGARLLADVSRAASAEIASRTLDRLLARRHVPAGSRARLLLAAADRLFAAGALAAAAVRYRQAAEAAPDSMDGQRGRVGELRVLT